MKIALGTDHAGFKLKEDLKKLLLGMGHEILDVGTYDEAPVDYPDYAALVAKAVNGNEAERGILICGSGVGASIAANKIRGIRASVCHDTYSARQGVEHDNMNIIVIGARVIGVALASDIARTFINAQFSNEDRHIRRLQKVLDLEKALGR